MGSWLCLLGVVVVLFFVGCLVDYGVDQDGCFVVVEQLDGYWLVVNYWVDWCVFCWIEILEMNCFVQVLEGQGGCVIGVNFDGLCDVELKKLVDGMGICFIVLVDDLVFCFKFFCSEVLFVIYIVDVWGEMCQCLLGEQMVDGILKQFEVLWEGC